VHWQKRKNATDSYRSWLMRAPWRPIGTSVDI